MPSTGLRARPAPVLYIRKTASLANLLGAFCVRAGFIKERVPLWR